MDSNHSGRRRFLKRAALAGLVVGAGRSVKGQSAESEAGAKDAHGHGEPSHFVSTARGTRARFIHITYYAPLQDSMGIITPNAFHFVQQHSSRLPDIDPQ